MATGSAKFSLTGTLPIDFTIALNSWAIEFALATHVLLEVVAIGWDFQDHLSSTT
jgi:hypothetical protein